MDANAALFEHAHGGFPCPVVFHYVGWAKRSVPTTSLGVRRAMVGTAQERFCPPYALRICTVRLAILFLGVGVEIAGFVSLVHLLGRVGRDPFDHASTFYRRAFCNRVGP